jgi:hypothetical protein
VLDVERTIDDVVIWHLSFSAVEPLWDFLALGRIPLAREIMGNELLRDFCIHSRIEIPVHEGHRITGRTHFEIIPTAKKLGKFLLCELTRSR